MTVIRNVTGTAFVVAEFRAEENRKLHPLYRDPIVHLFLDEESRKAAERIFASYPPIKNMVRIRTRYLDDRLNQQLQLGYQQVVILGAGLDTRAIRKPAPGVAYFEIDDKNILAFKKARLEGNGVDTNVRYIVGNYVSDGLIDLLKKSEFDFERPTHFIWEGNTMYLTAAAVSQVLGGITRHVTHFTVSLDYVTEEVIAKTTSDPEITVLSRGSQLWALLGLTVSVMSGVSQTTPRRRPWNTSRWRTFIGAYWATQPLDSPIYDYYSICTLQAVEQ